jgi:hypothetical protein
VFMADDAKAVLNNTPSQFALALQRSKLVVVEDRAVASPFCVLRPSDPGDRARTVAAQSGAVICTPEMLLMGSGVELKLQRAISWPRHILCPRLPAPSPGHGRLGAASLRSAGRLPLDMVLGG